MQSSVISYGMNAAGYNNYQKPQQKQNKSVTSLNYTANLTHDQSSINFTGIVSSIKNMSKRNPLSNVKMLQQALNKMTDGQKQVFDKAFGTSFATTSDSGKALASLDKTILKRFSFRMRMEEWLNTKPEFEDKYFDKWMNEILSHKGHK